MKIINNNDNNYFNVNNIIETLYTYSSTKKQIDYLLNSSFLDIYIKQLGYIFYKLSKNSHLEFDVNIIYKEICILLDIFSKNNLYGNLYSKILQSNCMLYNVSFYNINKKNLLIQSNKIYSKYTPFNKSPIVNSYKNTKIKILIIGFFMVNGKSITSVFRDRSEIIKKLDPNIFEKHLLIRNLDEDNKLVKSLLSSVDNIIRISNIHIDNTLINYIEQLRQANFDIVIYPSIGMHYASNIFANNRISPIQINTWGHSVTSGIDTIDYYISSSLYELEDKDTAQSYYSEKLLTLNSLTTYFIKYIEMTPFCNYKTKSELGIPLQKNILFCMHTIVKLNKEFYSVMRNILDIVPDSIILMRKETLSNEILNKINVLLNNKVLFVEDCSFKDFNAYMFHSDIILDSYPFGGCNSSLEAFAKGKIIITRPSKMLSGRFTYGFYKKMDIMDAIVDNYEEYINKVVYYLTNIKEKEKLEKRILNKSEILFNDKESVKEWEETLIDLYTKHNTNQ